MSDPQTIILTNVRLGYADIWKPKATAKDAEPKFSVNLLIDEKTKEGKANRAKIDAAWAYVVQQEWKGKEPTLKADRTCVFDGDECCNQTTGEVYPGYAGMTMFKASSKQEKRIDTRNRNKTPTTEADGVIYPGCYVDAAVRIYGIKDKDKGGNGIFASVGLLRFRSDGDPIGGGGIDTDAALDEMEDFDDEDEAV